MSRPFSYNDENFTVIGNILFLHVTSKKSAENNSIIVEIPPEIYKRLTIRSIMCNASRPFSNISDYDSYTLKFYFSEENGKYYLKTVNSMSNIYIITAYAPLKDI